MRLLLSNRFLLFTLAGLLATFLPSCKEKNPDFPLKLSSEFNYTGKGIGRREISCILYENEHSIWLGSAGKEGLVYNDGYGWKEWNEQNTGIAFDSITAMLRDGYGTLWIASKSGLIAYDGSVWRSLPEFEGKEVTALCRVGIGSIMAGVSGNPSSLAILQLNNWKFIPIESSQDTVGAIHRIQITENELMYLATSRGGLMVGAFGSAYFQSVVGMNPFSRDVRGICRTLDQTVWAVDREGAIMKIANNYHWVRNSGSRVPVSSMLAGNGVSFWTGTLGDGLLYCDSTETWSNFSRKNGAIASDTITGVYDAEPGYFFYTAPGGYIYLMKK
jgi:ligand-binding sensor domain-containing protein